MDLKLPEVQLQPSKAAAWTHNNYPLNASKSGGCPLLSPGGLEPWFPLRVTPHGETLDRRSHHSACPQANPGLQRYGTTPGLIFDHPPSSVQNEESLQPHRGPSPKLGVNFLVHLVLEKNHLVERLRVVDPNILSLAHVLRALPQRSSGDQPWYLHDFG